MRAPLWGKIGLVAAVVVTGAWAQGGAPAYTITPLPAGPLAQKTAFPESAFYAEPMAVNDAGLVAGAIRSPEATPFAHLWQAGKLRAVPGAVKPGAWATALGPRGEVAGQLTEEDGSQRAYLLRAGKLARLPKVPGCEGEWSAAVNIRGDVCGFAQTPEGQPRACLWPTGAAAAVDLHALVKKAVPSAAGSRAFSLNDRGEVVGELEDSENRSHAFHYASGKLVLLTAPGARESGAAAINATGQVAGWVNSGSGARLVRFQGGKTVDLGVLPGYRDMAPTGINARGEIVGYADAIQETPARGWVWRGGKLYDLTALLPPESGYTVGIVRGINGRGQIVGSAVHADRVVGVLLTPR